MGARVEALSDCPVLITEHPDNHDLIGIEQISDLEMIAPGHEAADV